jgi:hypothetical protein
MADPKHAGWKSHRPAAPDDATWPFKIKSMVNVARDPTSPDWHLPPARAVVLKRNDAFTYRVRVLDAAGEGAPHVENVAVERLIATVSTQQPEAAVQARDDCLQYGLPERGRGWVVKNKVKRGFNKTVSNLFKKLKGESRRFLVLRHSTLFYFMDCELKVLKGRVELRGGACVPSTESQVRTCVCGCREGEGMAAGRTESMVALMQPRGVRSGSRVGSRASVRPPSRRRRCVIAVINA